MRYLRLYLVASVLLLAGDTVSAQDDTAPVMIKINRILFTPGNKYAIYIPTFEFHMFFQKTFSVMKSAVTADYDYRRQDMGFGMSHALFKYAVNPGINVDDDLYFRKVFSDSTGIWRRKQSVAPFLMHEFNDNSSVGIAFKIEREWSPNRRMGTKIVSSHDRSLKLYYLYHTGEKEINDRKLLFFSLERSYKIMSGQFNYFILDVYGKFSYDLTKNFQYKGLVNFHGNLTPQQSPLFFIGGRSNLIGYENDEHWGRRAFSIQNLVEFVPFPEFEYSYKFIHIRSLSLLTEIDLGQVRGAARLKGIKEQTDVIKLGLGTGFGFNTDLPYMPKTDVHFILAAPSTDYGNVKYYFGFGGWLN